MFIPGQPQFYEGPLGYYPVLWSGTDTIVPDAHPWTSATVGSLYVLRTTGELYKKVADNHDSNDWVSGLAASGNSGVSDYGNGAKVWNRIYDMANAGSDTTITWLLLGDSIGTRSFDSVSEELESQYKKSGTFQRGLGGFSAVPLVDGLVYIPEGSAVVTLKNRYDWMPSGSYFSLSSATSDAMKIHDAGFTCPADTIKIYYLRTAGAGTFGVQLSATSISSGYTDEAGYTAVNCDNGGSDELGIITISKSLGKYALRISAVSGTVHILGCALYEGGTNNFLYYGETPGSNDSGSYDASSVLIPDFIADLDPDLITMQSADDLPGTITGLSALATWITASGIEKPTVVIVSQHGKSDYDMAPVSAYTESFCRDQGWGFVDGLDLTGGSYAAAADHGWDGDGTHYEVRAYQYISDAIMYALRIPSVVASSTTKRLRLSDLGGAKSEINNLQIRSGLASHGLEAAEFYTHPTLGDDLELRLKRTLILRNSSGTYVAGFPPSSPFGTIDGLTSYSRLPSPLALTRYQSGGPANDDPLIFVYGSAPEGALTASPRSICIRKTTSGSGSNIYIKVSGTGNTGWVPLAEVNSGTTASRPTSAPVGFSYFDTTLGYPIWRTASDWVNADGGTV